MSSWSPALILYSGVCAEEDTCFVVDAAGGAFLAEAVQAVRNKHAMKMNMALQSLFIMNHSYFLAGQSKDRGRYSLMHQYYAEIIAL